MDTQAIRTIHESLDISVYQYALLVCLSFHAYKNGREDKINPSVSTISKETGLSRSQVIREIKTAEEKGLIKVNRHQGKINHYDLLDSVRNQFPPDTSTSVSQTPVQGKPVPPRHHTSVSQTPKRSIKEKKKELSKELQTVVDKFHELGPRLPRCLKLNDTLKAKLRTRLKESSSTGDEKKTWFDDFCEAVALADERLGHRTTEWKPRFEYFLRNDDSAQAILEGKFKKYKEIQKCLYVEKPYNLVRGGETIHVEAKKCTDPAVRFGYCAKHAGG